MFKCYKAFTSFGYKLFVFLIYPLLAVAGCVITQTGLFGLIHQLNYMSCMPLISAGICILEVMSDMFPFGGVMSKKFEVFNLLKTSERGMQAYRKVLVFDMIRRFVYVVILNVFNVVLGVVILRNEFIGEFIPTFIFFGMGTYLLCSAAIGVARFFSSVATNYVLGYIASMLDFMLVFYFSSSTLSDVANISIITVLCVVVNVVIITIYKKKMEAGYND